MGSSSSYSDLFPGQPLKLEKPLTKFYFTSVCGGNIQCFKKYAKKLDELGEGGATKILNEVRDPGGKHVLHYAASSKEPHYKIPMFNYLVEELHLDVNALDHQGNTPLHESTLVGDTVISAYLLDHGANPNVENDGGFAPLHLAASLGQKGLLDLLISKGANVNVQTAIGTPLFIATKHGLKESIKSLLDHGADPNLVCPETLPPLLQAVKARSIECVKLLLKGGADPNISCCELTPLIGAASEGGSDMIKVLVEAGADPNARDFYDNTPIEIAAIQQHIEDVKALFPVTARLSYIPDWSIDGILEFIRSDEARIKGNLKVEEKFWEAKAKGAEAVEKRLYKDAIYYYSLALRMKPLDAAVLSNRSLCWARLQDGQNALKDALACINQRPDWQKAHFRAGTAWLLLNRYKEAADAFGKALKLDPENREIQVAYREALLDAQAVFMHENQHRNGAAFFGYDEEDEAYEEYVSSLF